MPPAPPQSSEVPEPDFRGAYTGGVGVDDLSRRVKASLRASAEASAMADVAIQASAQMSATAASATSPNSGRPMTGTGSRRTGSTGATAAAAAAATAAAATSTGTGPGPANSSDFAYSGYLGFSPRYRAPRPGPSASPGTSRSFDATGAAGSASAPAHTSRDTSTYTSPHAPGILDLDLGAGGDDFVESELEAALNFAYKFGTSRQSRRGKHQPPALAYRRSHSRR